MKINLTPNHGFLSRIAQHLIMRTLIFMLCATTFALSPNSGFSQDASIAISKDQTLSLEEVFNLIKAQTDYNFVYRSNELTKAPTFEVSSGIYKTSDLLNEGLDRIGYQYSFENNVVIVSRKKAQTPILNTQQQVTVSGVVRDSLGVPLAGATVQLKDSNRAVSTNMEGEFKFANVATGTSLLITYIGFLNQEVILTADNAKNLIVVLKADVSALDEVVLVSTGYQTIAKERSAGSFAKPDMEVFQNRSSTMNVAERLDGLIPGLTVNSSPGAELFNPLLVRGLATVQLLNSSPLIVVDGVPIPDISTQTNSAAAISGLANINPQDIRDITVLKDATAASIWGSRAANGVIVINTKRGSSSGAVSFQYDTFITMDGRPDQDYLRTLKSADFIAVAEQIFNPDINPYENAVGYGISGNGISPHEQILYDRNRGVISEGIARQRLDSLAAINNRSQINNLFYRPSILTTHTLSASGGKKGYSFYASGNYTGRQSNTPGEKDNRYKLNLRQNFDVGNRINIDIITDLTYQNRFSPNNININSRFLPYQLFRDANGNNIETSYMTELNDEVRSEFEQASLVDLSYTPLDELDLAYTKNMTKSMRNILGVDLDIFEGLKFQGTYSYTLNAVDNEEYTDHLAIAERQELVEYTVVSSPGATPQYILPNTGGKYAARSSDVEAWTVRNQLSFGKDWNDRMHQLNIIAGHEAQQQMSTTKLSQVRGYDDRLQSYEQREYGTYAIPIGNFLGNVVKPNFFEFFPGYGGLSNLQPLISERYFGRNETTTRFISYYGNAAYTFNRKYTLNASIRADQSNLFGLDKSAQNRPVWSVGGKWNIGRESFFQSADWLNSLALRATYGITGNAPKPGDAASFDILVPISSAFFPETGLRISTPGNRKLSWERTATTNLGIDYNINGRITGSLDYYQRKTSDLLGTIPTNVFTGYSSVNGNLGDLENDGFEIGLNTINIALKDFTWSSQLNMAFNENKITNLRLINETTTGDTRVNEQFVVGYPAFSLFAFDYAGLDENGDPQVRLADGTITTEPNVTTPEDIKHMGTTQPKWNGGFGNTFSYKNLSLNVNTVFSLGHVMRRDVNNRYQGTRLDAANYNFTSGNINEDFLDRWMEPGDEEFTDIPRFVDIESGNRDTDYYVNGDSNIISASYIKIRDINLLYRLPNNIFGNSGIDQVTLRGQVSNILLWADNDYDIDPEYHFYGGSRVLRRGQRVTLGLNVKF
ncbi:SusC/RagA family TonB-linked outer membrane protein [Leeuwenhoekiella polynyae]|uniref:TonB-linked SusC/RagA family outer membrane protein n=2 Tax=Leeuwenhoekiella polynyae TaxID=1550906 RepID=A0A4Q0PH15_9FLAO|nr:SusC/RagA family TonB-linked outer membrane protein [Leeuwenhoekiella polynyae]RXG26246.1 TonB-linked SusC/RagA family outer membrane protein [Leeuwenhoekiella polynyae]